MRLEHKPKLVLSSDVHDKVHGNAFNTKVAVWLTNKIGSMWCAYVFTLLALVSLPAALASGNTVVIVGWIAQTFIQLVLLPVIMVGQNVLQAHNDARAEADHVTLSVLSSVNHTQLQILKQQNQILDTIHMLVKNGPG